MFAASATVAVFGAYVGGAKHKSAAEKAGLREDNGRAGVKQVLCLSITTEGWLIPTKR